MIEINTIDNPGFSIKSKFNITSGTKEFEKISYSNKYNNWEKFSWDYQTDMDYSYFFDDWYTIECVSDEIICYGDPLKLNFLLSKVEDLTNDKMIIEHEYELLNWLSNWYKIECNGDWEHTYGITINITQDRVFVEIDIDDTRFDNDSIMSEIKFESSKNDWVNIEIENQKFVAKGDRSKLIQIIEYFIEIHERNQFPYRSDG